MQTVNILLVSIIGAWAQERAYERAPEISPVAKSCAEFASMCEQSCSGTVQIACGRSGNTQFFGRSCQCPRWKGFPQSAAVLRSDLRQLQSKKDVLSSIARQDGFGALSPGPDSGSSQDPWFQTKPTAVQTSANTKKDLSKFDQQVLAEHNRYRAKHGVPNLQSANCQGTRDVAQAHAISLAKRFPWQRSPNNDLHNSNRGHMGENIYYSFGHGLSTIAEAAVKGWYDEILNYNYFNPSFTPSTGHFTQVVWRDTTCVGCGRATSQAGTTFVVCNYTPPGNVVGRFAKNVLRPKY